MSFSTIKTQKQQEAKMASYRQLQERQSHLMQSYDISSIHVSDSSSLINRSSNQSAAALLSPTKGALATLSTPTPFTSGQGTNSTSNNDGQPSTQQQPNICRIPADFPTIQEAVDNCTPGDCLFLSPGKYILTEPISIYKPIHFIGIDELGGMAEVIFDCGALKPRLPLLRIESSCRIRGVIFRYQYDEQQALEENAKRAFCCRILSGDVIFDDCILESRCCGCHVAEHAYATFVNSIVRTKFLGLVIDGRVFFEKGEITGAEIGASVSKIKGIFRGEKLNVNKCQLGIDVEPHCQFQLLNAVVEDCVNGVTIYDEDISGKPPEIHGCEIRKCKRGIYISGEQCVCQLLKNYFHHCSESGICVDGGSAVITSNAVKNCPKIGIEVLCGKPHFESNVVQNCETGISISTIDAKPSFFGNEIAGSKTQGMMVSESAAPHVEQNIFGENLTNLMVMGGLGIYLKNEFLVAEEDNIIVRLAAANVVFEGNSVLGSTGYSGLFISEGAHAAVSGNAFSATKLSAVFLKACGTTHIHGNLMDERSCQAGAIVAQGGSVAKIGKNDVGSLAIDIFTDSIDTVVIEPQ